MLSEEKSMQSRIFSYQLIYHRNGKEFYMFQREHGKLGLVKKVETYMNLKLT